MFRSLRAAPLLALTLGAIWWAAPAYAQTNDTFATATVVTQFPFSDSISTASATASAEDPTDCLSAGATVWYAYTPAVDQSIQANTFGSDYDTTLQVVTGSPGSFSTVGCNDDALGLQSALLLDLQGGVTYYFVVGSCCDPTSSGGNLVFNLAEPPPPLTVALTVDGGKVDKSGNATVSGTITCSTDASGEAFGTLKQKRGRFIARGDFDVGVDCSATPTTWTATVESITGVAFLAGSAQAQATTFVCNGFECTEDAVTTTIRLHRH